MINSFGTTFEAREDKLQIENAFHGECIDFVAKVTTDGVPNDLQYYTVHGMYQAADTLSSDVWYPIQAALSGNSVVLHWTPANELGSDSYLIYCLMEKPNETAYPLVWRLNLQHSPGYPANPVDPIPHQIDFSQYDLLNAPWIEATETDTEWIVDKIVKVEGLDLTSLSTQDIVIAGGSLFDAVSSINENINGLSDDLSECCEGMNSKVDSLSATMSADFDAISAKLDNIVIDIPSDIAKEETLEAISSDVASVKNAVEAIVIPDDYATEDALEALSTHSNSISASLNASLGEVSSTTLRIESKVDAITMPTDYAKQTALNGISATVNNISSVVNNSSYGNSALLQQVRDNYTLTYQKATEIYTRIANTTNGLPMIEYKEDQIIGKLNESNNSLSAITNELTSGNEMLYGIEENTNDIFNAITDDEYGLHNITNIAQQIRDSITYNIEPYIPYLNDIPTINQNTEFIAYDLVGGLPSVRDPAISAATKASENNALLKDSTNGLSAIKNEIAAAKNYANANADMLSSEIYGLIPIKNIAEEAYQTANDAKAILNNSTYGLANLWTIASATKNFAQGIYNTTQNQTYGNQAIRSAVDSANTYLSSSTYGLQAIKNAVNSLPQSFPTDYAKQSTLNGIGSTLAQVTTPKVANIEATVNDSVYGNQAIKNNVDSAYTKMLAIESLLGDCAEALDIINGEVL